MKIGPKLKELYSLYLEVITITAINTIKKLIKEECAGHTMQNNYCCEYDQTCTFFVGGERCSYFEKGVLPLDNKLEDKYWREKDITIKITKKPKSRITCKRCGQHVEASSNRQQYCGMCQKIVRKEQTKKAMQKIRKGVNVSN